jgi:hypothetical protein
MKVVKIMANTSLVKFESNMSIVPLRNDKFKMVGERLLTPKEFKTSRNLKGNEGKRAYNAYMIENGKRLNGDLGKQMMEGKYIVKTRKDYATGVVQVKLQEVIKIVDPVDAPPVKPTEAAEAAIGRMTEAERAAFIAKFIGAPKA